MSDELHDEVEAINSIYGDSTLVPSPTPSSDPSHSTYILSLPNEASSLILSFPSTYPATAPPEVVATHHAADGKKGAGARDLRLFRDAVKTVWGEGMVCVFDAVEEFQRLLTEIEEQEREEDERKAEADGKGEEEEEVEEEVVDLNSLPAPPWTVSEPWVELKSTFVAHVAPVTNPDQAKLYLNQLLASDKRIANATHNISAWRIRSDNPSSTATYQDCDDDGETAAGGRLLHLMQLMDIWDAMVVVTRWYGGVHMGPRRFAVINGVAREGFVKAGLVREEKDGKKKGK